MNDGAEQLLDHGAGAALLVELGDALTGMTATEVDVVFAGSATNEGDLSDEGRRVYDEIMATRGEVDRPFQILLAAPELLRRVAHLGRLMRYAQVGRVQAVLQAVQKIGESSAEVVEMVVRQGAKAAGVALRDLHLPNGALIGAVVREEEAFIPHGRTVVREGDVVVAFVLPGLRDRIRRLFARRAHVSFAADPDASVDSLPEANMGHFGASTGAR